MAYDGKIYKLCDSALKNQPYLRMSETNWTWIGKQTEENPWGDWGELAMTFPEGVDTIVSKRLYFIIKHPQALEWDYYGDNGSGTNGLISHRAKDLLGEYLRTCCNFLQTAINDQPYYYLLNDKRKTFDCWDRENSVFNTYDPDNMGTSFRKITSFSFFRDQLTDPMAFRIPEYYAIFVTEGIKNIIEEAGFNGFEFVLFADREGGDGTVFQPCYDTIGPSWTYRNDYFRFCLCIPEHWSISAVKKGTVKPFDPQDEGGLQFQRSDDDLPSKPHDYRGLVSADLFVPNSTIEIDAHLSMTVFANLEKKDRTQAREFRQQLIDSGDTIIADSTWDCNGLIVSYIDTEMTGHWGNGTNRWVFWQVGPGLWIHCRIAGFNEDSFRHAIEVFGSLSPI